MSTYVREIISATVYYSQKEKYIYGNSRLGVMNDSLPLYGSQNATYSQTTWTHGIGKRNYELSNHLGNVLSVISDKVIAHDDNSDNVVDWFLADILQSTDYSAFGVQLSGRTLTKSVSGLRKNRHGFQGQEEDDEIKGEGNSVNYTFRMHDPRLGRFFAIDPLTAEYSNLTPYQFSSNSPIYLIEREGLEGTLYTYKVWYTGDKRNVETISVKKVEGLKYDVIKSVIQPYGKPNGKTLYVEYSLRNNADGSKGVSGGGYSTDNLPSVSDLNKQFSSFESNIPAPKPPAPEKSFRQEFNDAVPSWLRDGHLDGGDDGANLGTIDETTKEVLEVAGEVLKVAAFGLMEFFQKVEFGIDVMPPPSDIITIPTETLSVKTPPSTSETSEPAKIVGGG